MTSASGDGNAAKATKVRGVCVYVCELCSVCWGVCVRVCMCLRVCVCVRELCGVCWGRVGVLVVCWVGVSGVLGWGWAWALIGLSQLAQACLAEWAWDGGPCDEWSAAQASVCSTRSPSQSATTPCSRAEHFPMRSSLLPGGCPVEAHRCMVGVYWW